MQSRDSMTTQRIQEAAYYQWIRHGRLPNHDLADWLVAEAIIDAADSRRDKAGGWIGVNPCSIAGTAWSTPGG
jgi:hypothetical protein